MKLIRCSSLDQLFACSPSILSPDGAVRIDPYREESELGKMIHSLTADYIETGKFDIRGEIARRGLGDSDTEDAEYLMSQAVFQWDEMKRYFPRPATERVIRSSPRSTVHGDYELTGTIDVLSPVDNSAIFVDWKSGEDNGYANQMFGYADCVWDFLGQPNDIEIVGIIGFLRLRKYVKMRYTPAKLKAWRHDLEHNVLGRATTYRPGEHCKKCNIAATCAARQAVVTSTFQALMMPKKADPEDKATQAVILAGKLLSGLTTDNKCQPEVAEALSNMRFRLSLAKKAIEDMEKLERDTVERVGPIPLADGTVLTLSPVETVKVDPLRGLKTLRGHLSDAEIADAMKLSLPTLLNKKTAKFLRGEKKAARMQLIQDLEAAGALSVSTHTRLTEKDPSIEDGNEPTGKDSRAASPTG